MPGIDSNTILLIRSDSFDGDTGFPDAGAGPGCPRSLTTAAGVVHSTDRAKFGSTSIKLPQGDALITNDDDAWRETINGDWTVDLWIWLSSTAENFDIITLFSLGDWAASIRLGCMRAGTDYSFFISGPSFEQGRVTAAAQDAWHHVELVKQQDDYRLFIDGSMMGDPYSAPAEAYPYLPYRWSVSNRSVEPVYIDEYRVSRVARHIENFTPPAEPYSLEDSLPVAAHISAHVAAGGEPAPRVDGFAAYELPGGPYSPATLDHYPYLANGAVNDESPEPRFIPVSASGEGGDTWDFSYGVRAISPIDFSAATIFEMVIHFRTLSWQPYGPAIADPTTWGPPRTFSLYSSPDNLDWTHVEDFDNPQIIHVDDYHFKCHFICSEPVTEKFLKLVTPGMALTVDDGSENPCLVEATEIEALEAPTPGPVSLTAARFSLAAGLAGNFHDPVLVDAAPFTLTANAAGACVVAMPPAAFAHSQSIDPPKITVTRDIPAGTLVLRDQADGLELLGPATLEIRDPVDALTFAAALGVTGGLTLADPRDHLTQGLGGEIPLLDPQDGLVLFGRTEIIGAVFLEDGLDFLEIDPRAGTAGVLSLFETWDGMDFRGRGEIQAILALNERIDVLGLQAAAGTLAALALTDRRDVFDATGRQVLQTQLELGDSLDLLELVAIAAAGYSGRIEYRKERL
jgi:hypothetical protein